MCMHEWQTIRSHACFRLDIQFPIGDSLQLSGGESTLLALWQSISYRITRSPEDLLAHTRRVRLCQEPALHGKLAGALDDLAYVLGDRGTSLQQRLRAESAGILADANAGNCEITPGTDTHTPTDGRVLPTMTQLLRLAEAGEAACNP